MPQRIIIVGAGIIGASLAFHLARAGCTVTVFEAALPANAASGRSFGWINASFYLTPAHHRLRVASMHAYRQLQTLLPDTAPNWQGALWFEGQGDTLTQKAAELAALGYPVETLTAAQITTLEPSLAQIPAQALRFSTEAAIDPATLTHALLAASGATLHKGLAVKSLIETAGHITGVRTAIGPFAADHVILAAGIATPQLLQTIGLDLPMLTRPGVLLHTTPVPWQLHHIIVTPEQEIRQDAQGRILAPATANHQADASETVENLPQMLDATLTRLRALFNADLTLDHHTIGYRPVPGDGLPVLGLARPGLSLAVMHSGVTLAAGVGQALAAEITGQGASPLLSDFRPARLIVRGLSPATPAGPRSPPITSPGC